MLRNLNNLHRIIAVVALMVTIGTKSRLKRQQRRIKEMLQSTKWRQIAHKRKRLRSSHRKKIHSHLLLKHHKAQLYPTQTYSCLFLPNRQPKQCQCLRHRYQQLQIRLNPLSQVLINNRLKIIRLLLKTRASYPLLKWLNECK